MCYTWYQKPQRTLAAHPRAKTEEKHLLGEDAKYRAYHAWMARHGLITRRLGRLASVLAGRSEPSRHHPPTPSSQEEGEKKVLN